MARKETPHGYLETLRGSGGVIVALRNNRKVQGSLRAFDQHFNLIIENAVESRVQEPSLDKGLKRRERKEFLRRFKYLFIRGDSIVVIHPSCPHASSP